MNALATVIGTASPEVAPEVGAAALTPEATVSILETTAVSASTP